MYYSIDKLPSRKLKTTELKDSSLDWAVAKCECEKGIVYSRDYQNIGFYDFHDDLFTPYEPSSDWSIAGPIIEREKIAIDYSDGGNNWCAAVYDSDGRPQSAKDPLCAAMRCYVASKLGDEVEIPDELL